MIDGFTVCCCDLLKIRYLCSRNDNYLQGVNRPAGQTYDITIDNIKADLKCVTGGAGNIVKYAKKALTKQGGEAVVFEIPSHSPEFYAALAEARRKCIGKIFFYFTDDLELKEIR